MVAEIERQLVADGDVGIGGMAVDAGVLREYTSLVRSFENVKDFVGAGRAAADALHESLVARAAVASERGELLADGHLAACCGWIELKLLAALQDEGVPPVVLDTVRQTARWGQQYLGTVVDAVVHASLDASQVGTHVSLGPAAMCRVVQELMPTNNVESRLVTGFLGEAFVDVLENGAFRGTTADSTQGVQLTEPLRRTLLWYLLRSPLCRAAILETRVATWLADDAARAELASFAQLVVAPSNGSVSPPSRNRARAMHYLVRVFEDAPRASLATPLHPALAEERMRATSADAALHPRTLGDLRFLAWTKTRLRDFAEFLITSGTNGTPFVQLPPAVSSLLTSSGDAQSFVLHECLRLVGVSGLEQVLRGSASGELAPWLPHVAFDRLTSQSGLELDDPFPLYFGASVYGEARAILRRVAKAAAARRRYHRKCLLRTKCTLCFKSLLCSSATTTARVPGTVSCQAPTMSLLMMAMAKKQVRRPAQQV